MEKMVSVFELTPKAREMLSEALSKGGYTGQYVRVEVFEGGGCACGCGGGVSYAMSLAEKPLEDDVVEEVDGVRLATPKTTLDLVRGSKIDYYEGLEGSGFIILNPNVESSSCGCGAH
ncbi:MAG: iron-sulfur cluster assembly accessory protein [Thermoprotei archaeon]